MSDPTTPAALKSLPPLPARVEPGRFVLARKIGDLDWAVWTGTHMVEGYARAMIRGFFEGVALVRPRWKVELMLFNDRGALVEHETYTPPG